MSDTQLFTLGYEKRNADEFVRLLTQHNIALLADVRKDPVSRKKGFSKRQLEENLNDAGIEYRHFPEVGVPKEKRQHVSTKDDYQQMFEWYQQERLPQARATLEELQGLLEEYQRIALMCYERDPKQCHRLYVAKALEESLTTVKHI